MMMRAQLRQQNCSFPHIVHPHASAHNFAAYHANRIPRLGMQGLCCARWRGSALSIHTCTVKGRLPLTACLPTTTSLSYSAIVVILSSVLSLFVAFTRAAFGKSFQCYRSVPALINHAAAVGCSDLFGPQVGLRSSLPPSFFQDARRAVASLHTPGRSVGVPTTWSALDVQSCWLPSSTFLTV